MQLRNVDETTFNESLAELKDLLLSANGKVAGVISQKRDRPHSRCYVGTGKLKELKQLVGDTDASSVVFDEKLSPAQLRSLEDSLEVKVMDRGNLILDIFATRARSAEARIQVELAQLQYLLPRLTKMWSHFTRHAGGIGTRGPGETQLESDRRQIGRKIVTLKQKLAKIGRQRTTQRKQRLSDTYKIALVGYTNAGKSTLFNHLTKAGVWADDCLFCTLDAVTRYLPIRNQKKVVISDTVGFIKKLPPELVASFASTLDEVRHANLLLHLVDISHNNAEEHYNRTNKILKDIGASDISRFVLLNKCDLLDGDPIPVIDSKLAPHEVFPISVKTTEGLDNMLKFLVKHVEKHIRIGSLKSRGVN